MDKSWVADGFDMTDDRALEMLAKFLPFAEERELGTRVIQRPDKKLIQKIQGYAK